MTSCNCDSLARGEFTGDAAECPCGAVYVRQHATRSAARRWQWSPSVRRDMYALAWSPGCGDPPPGSLGTDDSVKREISDEERSARRLFGSRRLREMCRVATDGERFAEVVFMVHGIRGEAIRARESTATYIAKEYARPGELARYKRGRGHGLAGGALLIAFGNELIGAAEDAYERNVWRDVAPVTKPASKAVAFAEEIAARWAEARARLAKATEPH